MFDNPFDVYHFLAWFEETQGAPVEVVAPGISLSLVVGLYAHQWEGHLARHGRPPWQCRVSFREGSLVCVECFKHGFEPYMRRFDVSAREVIMTRFNIATRQRGEH